MDFVPLLTQRATKAGRERPHLRPPLTSVDRPEESRALHEITNVKQERGPGRRRWFESEDLELVVWLDAHDVVTGFQICYDFGQGGHALTWRRQSGFAHTGIDAGDESPFFNRTPVLRTPQTDPPWAELIRTFEARSVGLEPALRSLVLGRLAEQAGAGSKN
jgi:hypothetical protein